MVDRDPVPGGHWGEGVGIYSRGKEKPKRRYGIVKDGCQVLTTPLRLVGIYFRSPPI